MIGADDLIKHLNLEKVKYYKRFGYFDGALDCRVYLDRNSYREFLSSCNGAITLYAYELHELKTILGYKVYIVDVKETYLDVVVRNSESVSVPHESTKPNDKE